MSHNTASKLSRAGTRAATRPVTYRCHEQLEPDRSDGRTARRERPPHPLLQAKAAAAMALPTARPRGRKEDISCGQATRMLGMYLLVMTLGVGIVFVVGFYINDLVFRLTRK